MPELKEPAFYHTKIKDWPEDERPREKLKKYGGDALSDAELLDILIRTGVRKATAVDLTKKVLSECKNLREVAGESVSDLKKLGIGEARAVAIVAAFELARRLHALPESEKPTVRSP
jgi:DNA repair protein RadC